MPEAVVMYREFGDILVTGFSIAIIKLYRAYIPPYSRGFACDDTSLAYPLTSSGISLTQVFIFFYLIPVILFLLCETALFPWRSEYVKKKTLLYSIYNIFMVFSFGICLSMSLVILIQNTAGALGPHFMDICNPDVDCSLPENRFRYFTNYTCQLNPAEMLPPRTSFPSAHSSWAIQTSLFLTFYIEAKFNWKQVNLPKRTLQGLTFAVGLGCALSKISDYKHHWSDVLVGLVIGTSFAFYMAFHMTDWFLGIDGTRATLFSERSFTPSLTVMPQLEEKVQQ